MRVLAFAPSRSAASQEAGGITAEGFPITSYHVQGFPTHITIPVVMAFSSPAGTNYDSRTVIVATSPDGDRVGTLEFAWEWPDNPPQTIKFRVFAKHLAMRVPKAGIYSVGLYESLHRTETDRMFPLPVLKSDPLIRNLANP